METKLFLLLATIIVCASAFEWTPDNKDRDDYVDPNPEPTTKTPNKPKNCGSKHTRQNPPKSGKTLVCSQVTAYFAGTFHNKYHTHVDKKVQFQARMFANETDGHVYSKIDKWNETVSPSKAFKWGDGLDLFVELDKPFKVPYHEFVGLFLRPRNYLKEYNKYHFLNHDYDISAKFRLVDTVGQCTRVQTLHGCLYETDKTMHDFCICCGDKYDPDHALDCPSNPWSEYKC